MSLEGKLVHACKTGDLPMVKKLVSLGADIHAKDDLVLRMASKFGHNEVVNYLENLKLLEELETI